MSVLLIGLGFLLVVEGLVLALAPNVYEELIALVKSMPVDQRRALGLGAAALGTVLLWLAI